MSPFRVAFVQGRPRFGRPAENLDAALALASTVDADLVVIPELWSSGYVFSSHAEVASLAEDAGRGATARALSAAARRERRHYVAGFPERHAGRAYNSAMLVGPGGVRAVYRKLHLFEREREWFAPGNLPLAVHRVGPARIGMMICFDWRFPETARVLALLGADVIVHPSNLVMPHAPDAMITRALENRVACVTANRTGREARSGGTLAFTGRSQIVDPRGEVLVRAGRAESVAGAADLDLAAARRKWITDRTPLFASRRPGFYRALVTPAAGAAARARPGPARRRPAHRRSGR
jgi:predicted amidohydrolase